MKRRNKNFLNSLINEMYMTASTKVVITVQTIVGWIFKLGSGLLFLVMSIVGWQYAQGKEVEQKQDTKIENSIIEINKSLNMLQVSNAIISTQISTVQEDLSTVKSDIKKYHSK